MSLHKESLDLVVNLFGDVVLTSWCTSAHFRRERLKIKSVSLTETPRHETRTHLLKMSSWPEKHQTECVSSFHTRLHWKLRSSHVGSLIIWCEVSESMQPTSINGSKHEEQHRFSFTHLSFWWDNFTCAPLKIYPSGSSDVLDENCCQTTQWVTKLFSI